MPETERPDNKSGESPSRAVPATEEAPPATEQKKREPSPGSAIGALRAFFDDAHRFFREELWDRDVGTLPRMKRFLFSLCRIGTIVVRGFIADNCGLQASALTYISLMSMIPVLALMFSFSKGIGMQNRIIEIIGLEKVRVEKMIDGRLETKVEFRIADAADEKTGNAMPPPPANGTKDGASAAEPTNKGANGSFHLSSLPPPLQKAVITIFTYVENTSFGALGLFGSLLLFWTAVKAISKLEHTFNSIWGVKEARPLFQRLTEYIFLLIMLPVVFLVATSLNAAMSSHQVIEKIQEFAGPLAWLYQRLIRFSGFALVGLAFTFLYAFMPNTKVKLFPALVAGFVAGTLWFLTQWAYITGQIGLTRFNAIYGTFAAVPFFLAWLYANWMLLLFGAEVCFAIQHHRTYLLEGVSAGAPPAVLALLGVVLTYETCRAFFEGRRGWAPGEYAREHAIPARMLGAVTSALTRAGVLVRVAGPEEMYVPGKELSALTLADVERAFRGDMESFSRQFLTLLPATIGEVFVRRYEAFRDDLAKVSFRDALAE